MAGKLLQLFRQQGGRLRRSGNRRVLRLRPIKPALAHKRELQAIISEMVRTVFAHVPALIEEVKKDRPVLTADSGEVIGIADASAKIDDLLSLIVTQTQNVAARLQIRVRQWSAKVEQRQREQFRESVFAATKIHADTILNPFAPQETIDHYVAWSTSLIRDVGDEARRRIGNAVLSAVRHPDEDLRTLAKQIQEYADMSYRRAKNIAADQTTKLNAALNEARQKEAGITHFTWIHSGSPHPREWHLERDGELFEWDDPEIEAGDYPGEPPFCGCTAQATLVDDSGNAIEPDLSEVDAEG